ncbi:hypothetical protein [Cohnella faecalis]|uniref:hypothetical protein n=1 Tax=Cohnella faecalis TaxID=2315694 RepID=UPI001F23CB19|nr:hypothetical protein [Cohnella faecalis]
MARRSAWRFSERFSNHYIVNGTKIEYVHGMQAIFILFFRHRCANLLTLLFLPGHRQVMAQQQS